MNVSASDLYLDTQSLASLKTAAAADREESTREVAEHFEALFIQMMLKSMRDASLGDDILGGKQSKFYRDMYDQQIALNMSKSGGIGLADMMVKQLSAIPESAQMDSFEKHLSEKSFSADNIRRFNGSGTAWTNANTDIDNDSFYERRTPWEDSKTFVRDLWPHAKQASEVLGVDPRVLVAQSALETGWGKHTMTRSDGYVSNSLFGIKANHSWEGDSVNMPTLEYENGQFNKQRASFRAYNTVAESMDDYVDFVTKNPRYKLALERTSDPEGYTQALQDAGYATDPDYADKIMQILKSPMLNDAVNFSEYVNGDAIG